MGPRNREGIGLS